MATNHSVLLLDRMSHIYGLLWQADVLSLDQKLISCSVSCNAIHAFAAGFSRCLEQNS